MKRFLKISEVETATGLSRATVYRKIAGGTFPAPVKVGAAARWPEQDIEAWKATLCQERDLRCPVVPAMVRRD